MTGAQYSKLNMDDSDDDVALGLELGLGSYRYNGHAKDAVDDYQDDEFNSLI
jgi:hypothetical protein